MVGDLVAFLARDPDVVEADGDILHRRGKADIRPAGLHARRLVVLGLFARDQCGAGEEVGEMGAGAAGDVAALRPERIVMGTVEGNQQQLLRLVRRGCGRRIGQRWLGDHEREAKGKKRTRHRKT